MRMPVRSSARLSNCSRDDRGASAVEYGLLVAGVTGAFIVATAGFNGALGEIFGAALAGIGAKP